MTIQVKTTDYTGVDDPSWLGSAHGYESMDTGTLDVSKFTAGTYYPNGVIPGGTKLGLVTATKLYGPYDDTATDGRETLVGFLGKAQVVGGQTRLVSPIFKHGEVVESRLPFPVDAAGWADVDGRIWRA